MSDTNFITQTLRTRDDAQAIISAYGAHVCSWQPASGGERLYLSSRSQAGAGLAIRGGVPVIFPQFAGEGPLLKHGFARTQEWQLIGIEQAERSALARYRLRDNAATLAIWPHQFVAELSIHIGGDALEVALTISNTGGVAFSFTAALHSYLRVDDLSATRVLGLQGLRYRDSANANGEAVETAAALAIRGEIDRIYFDAPPSLLLTEPGSQLRISSRGFADAVIWNPGADKAAQLKDMDEGGWRQMVCVEAATIGRPITLVPQQQWSGAQRLIAEQ